MRKSLHHRQLSAIRLWMLATALLFSIGAYPLGLSEIQISSNLGEPIKAQVNLTGVSAAEVFGIKVRLASVDEYRKSGLQYPDTIKFTFNVEDELSMQPVIHIASLQPINEPFIELLLEVSSSARKVSRSYTILLDPPADLPVPPLAGMQPEAVQKTLEIESTQPIAPVTTTIKKPVAIIASMPEKPDRTGIKHRNRHRNQPRRAVSMTAPAIDIPAQSNAKPGARQSSRAPLGGDSLALSMSLSISTSAPDRPSSRKDSKDALQEELIAKEKTLNELKEQIAEMQGVILALQGRLINSAIPTAAAGSGSSATPTAGAAAVPLAQIKPHTVPTIAQQHAEEWITSLIPASIGPTSGMAVLLLSTSGLFWYRKRRREWNGIPFYALNEMPEQPEQPEQPETPGSRADEAEVDLPIGVASIKVPSKPDNNGEHAMPELPATGQTQSANQPKEGANGQVFVNYANPPPTEDSYYSEVDSMIEEAELYAIYGRPNKTIEILNALTSEYPEKVEIWLLLLSIYRDKKFAKQFEAIASKFLLNHGDNEVWKDIQAVGHSIDPDNPNYSGAESNPEMNAALCIKPKRRLLGDILVDMKAISLRDLESNFNRLRDGRIGNFLVARGLITRALLEDALQEQARDTPSESDLPLIGADKPRWISDVLVQMGAVTEHELEHVLANFDPKRFGHCGNYLETCGLITKKQLHAALLQQLTGAIDAKLDLQVEKISDPDDDYIVWV